MAPEQGPPARRPNSPLTVERSEVATAREATLRLLDAIGLSAAVQVSLEADGIFVDVGLPARGPRGKTRPHTLPAGRQAMLIGAIQHLVHLIVRHEFPSAPPVYLAPAGQREQRLSQLQGKTVAVARIVLESGREMALDVVYEYEMKTVRDALKQFPSLEVRVVGVGEELRRNVIIAPARR